MEDKDNKPLTATTVRELGIEIAGFIKLVNHQFQELNKTIRDLTAAHVATNNNKANKEDLNALASVVADKADKDDLNALAKLVADKADKEKTAELLATHSSNIKKLQNSNTLKIVFMWIVLVASAIINIVLVYNLFSGR